MSFSYEKNIVELKDFSSSSLDPYARLSEIQLLRYNEPREGLFIAESPKVIERALNAGYRPLSLLLEKSELYGHTAEVAARCGEIPIYTGDSDLLSQLTGFRLTRGMLALMQRLPLPKAEDVCAGARRIAVLENVMNPTNVGAIFRSAAALGIDAVLLTPGCSDPLYRRAARVSMGTVFQVPWTYLGQNSGQWHTGGMDILKQLGFQTAAMALDDNSISIDDPILQSVEKLAILLGTEGDGLAISTIANCDYTVKIPMSHDVDSLNVAAASAVAFWQLAGSRQA